MTGTLIFLVGIIEIAHLSVRKLLERGHHESYSKLNQG